MQVLDGENLNVPNAITFARLAGVAHEAIRYAQTDELRHIFQAGLYFLLDIADGPAARRLNQVTEFGAAFDPMVDKASVAGLAGAAVMNHEIDAPVVASLGLINLSNIAATMVANKRGALDVHGVASDGKQSQMGMNTGAGLNIIGNNLRKHATTTAAYKTGNVLRHTGTAIAVTSAASLGIKATIGYWRKALAR